MKSHCRTLAVPLISTVLIIGAGELGVSTATAACSQSSTNQNCENASLLTGVIAIQDTNDLTLFNTTTGILDGTVGGIYADTLDLTNLGTVKGGFEGIYVSDGATISNDGEIIGGNQAFWGTNYLDLTNNGIIQGINAQGILLIDGVGALATIDNRNTIQGATQGIIADNLDLTNSGHIHGILGILVIDTDTAGGTANIQNSGTIEGENSTGDSYGILADDLELENSGTISGGFMGIGINNSAVIQNSGRIIGTNVGADYPSFGIAARGELELKNSGVIEGQVGVAVATATGASLRNSGTIRGLGGVAIDFRGTSIPASGVASQNGTLTFLPGTRIDGDILLGEGDHVSFKGGDDIGWLITLQPGSNYSLSGSGSGPYVIDEANNTFATLDPTAHAVADRAMLALSRGISASVDNRLSAYGYHDAKASTNFWASGFAGTLSQDGSGPNLDADYGFAGGLIGFDHEMTEELTLGLLFGGGKTELEIDHQSQSVDSDFWTGGLYGRFTHGSTFVDLSFVGSTGDNRSERLVANNQVNGVLEHAKADYNSYFLSPSVRFGYHMEHTSGATWTPSATVRFIHGQIDGYEETGSDQDLTIDDQQIQNLEGRVELSRREAFDAISSMGVDTEIVVGAIAVTRVGDSEVSGTLIGQELAFDATGDDSAYGAFIRGGLSFALAQSAQLSLDAEATWMSDAAFVGGGQATLSFVF